MQKLRMFFMFVDAQFLGCAKVSDFAGMEAVIAAGLTSPGRNSNFELALRIFIADDLRENKKAGQNAASKNDPVTAGTLFTKTGLLVL